MAAPASPGGINTQVQSSVGKCVPHKVVAKKSLHTLVAGVFVRWRKGGVFAAGLRLPAPQPALLFSQHCSDYARRHFAGGTLHPALVFSQCDRSRGGWGVRRSVWWKSNQKNRSGKSNLCLNYEEGSAVKLIFMKKKVCGTSPFSVGKQELKKYIFFSSTSAVSSLDTGKRSLN